MKLWLKSWTIFIFLLLANFTNLSAQGGGCVCDNCPQFMPDFFTGDFNLNVVGGTSNDLSSPNQGVCGVRLVFEHEYVGDLLITLTSPSGQSINLVGGIGLFGGTDFSTWDVLFVPCSEPAFPDPGRNDRWANNEMIGQNQTYTGSYYPAQGNACLEDFDTGPINGTWILTVDDDQAIDVGIFLDYEIIFCDDDGISCNSNPCGTTAIVDYDAFFCSGDEVVIDASGSIGSQYQWTASDGGVIQGATNGPTITVTTGGTYVVTVFENGCPDEATAIVTEILGVPSADIDPSDVLNCNNPLITLFGNTDASDDVFYQWFQDGNELSTSQNVDITEPGDYTLVVVNTNTACIGQSTLTIPDESSEPVATAIATGLIGCSGDPIGLEGDSDIPFSTYEWTGPNNFESTAQDPEVNEVGTYTLVVTAPDGCTGSIDVVVDEDDTPPEVTVTASGEIDCTNMMATLTTNTPSDDLDYEWSGPDGFTSIESDPEVMMGGLYTVTVTGTNGCTSTAEESITASIDLPDAMVDVTGDLSCSITEVDLIGMSTTTGATFSWSGPNNFSSNAASPVGVTEAGTYTLTITALNACTETASVTINLDDTDPDGMADGGEINCNESEINLSASSTTENVTYSWTGPDSFSSTEQNPMVDEIGTYTLTVTAANGCTFMTTASVTDNTTEPDISVTSGLEIDCINTTSTISGSSTTDVTYSWTGPDGFTSDQSNPDVSQGGDYVLIITAANGCTATDMVSVTQSDDLPDAFATADQTLDCNIQTTGLSGSSTDPTVTYSWTGPGGFSSADANPTGASEVGTYTLIVTASNGCTSTAEAVVELNDEEPDISTTLMGDNSINCNTQMVDINGSSTDANATIEWTGPGGFSSSDATISASEAGTFTFTVTGANGCTSMETVNIMEDFSVPENVVAPNQIIDCNGDIMIDVSTSTMDVTYSWTGPNGFSSTDQNPMISDEGTYDVILTGSNGCTEMASLEVTGDFTEPDVSASGGILTCDDSNAQLTGNSTSSNITYAWTGPGGFSSDEQNPIATSAGTYTLTVMGSNGCTASFDAQITTDENTPTAFATTQSGGPGVINCNQSEVQISGSSDDANVTFEWTYPDNVTTSTEIEPVITAPGIYTFTVTALNGCTNEANVEIFEDLNPPEDVQGVGGTIFCDPQSVQLDASSSTIGAAASWTGPNGFTSNVSNPTVTEPGEYTVVMTGGNGCTASSIAMVDSEVDAPDITLQNPDMLSCSETSVQIAVSTPETNVAYIWTGPNGFSANTSDPMATAAGEYFITVTNIDNGCTTASSLEVEADDDTPTANIEGEVLNCNLTSFNFVTTSSDPNATYDWLGPNGFTSDEQNPLVEEDGEYTLILTASNGCTIESIFTVMADIAEPEVELEGILLTCNEPTGEISAASVADDVTFAWVGPNGFTAEIANPTVGSEGEYVLTATGSNGCQYIETLIVDVDGDMPDIGTVGNTIDCNNTVVAIQGNSTTDNVTYAWTGPNGFTSIEESPDVDAPGIYTLTVTSSNGCSSIMDAEVMNDIDAPNISTTGSILQCNQTETEISASSTTDNVTYAWTGPNGFTSDEANPMVNISGIYDVVITAANGCSSTEPVEVMEDINAPDILVDIASDNVIDCNTEMVLLEGSSTTNDVVYEWIGPNGFSSNTPEAQATEEGFYTLTITALNGCISTESILITDDFDTPDIAVNGGIITCETNTVEISASSTTDNVTYEWIGPSGFTSDEANPLVGNAGDYTIIITAANGCSSTSMTSVGVDEGLPFLTAETDVLNCIVQQVPLDASASTPPGDSITYQWYFNGSPLGSEGLVQSASEPGIYTLEGINNNNACADILEIEVELDDTAPVAVAGDDVSLTCDDPTTILDGGTSTGTGTLMYQWTTQQGTIISTDQSFESDIEGTIILTVTNISNGCSSIDEVVVTPDNLQPLASIAEADMLDCAQTTVTLDGSASVSQTNNDLSFTWIGPMGNAGSTPTIDVTEPGTYTLQIVDASNGCDSEGIMIVEQNIDAPTASIAEPGIITCIDQTVFLDANSSSNGDEFTYVWTGPTGATISDPSIANPEIDLSGNYLLTILNSENGCSSSSSIQVLEDTTIPDAIAVVENGLTLDCETETVVLTGSGSSAGNDITYTWEGNGIISNSTTNLDITVNLPGTYTMTVLDNSNGCSNAINVNVDQNADVITDFDPSLEDEECFGDANGSIFINNSIVGGTGPFVYSINGGAFSTTDSYTNLAPGTYNINIEDAAGCTWEEEVFIEGAQEVLVDLGPEVETISLGDSYTLSPNSTIDLSNYTWSDTSLVGTSPEITPSGTSTFNITVFDDNGCSATDAITIFVEKSRPVYIPTAFSPNGDGENDVFMIYAGSAISNIKTFKIFDRWGSLLFEASDFPPNDPTFGWDGISNNQKMDDAVFVYYAEIEFIDGLVELYKGDVTIRK